MVLQQKIICNENIIMKFARFSSGFYPKDIYTGSENAHLNSLVYSNSY